MSLIGKLKINVLLVSNIKNETGEYGLMDKII
jgi:hypothetical protein